MSIFNETKATIMSIKETYSRASSKILGLLVAAVKVIVAIPSCLGSIVRSTMIKAALVAKEYFGIDKGSKADEVIDTLLVITGRAFVIWCVAALAISVSMHYATLVVVNLFALSLMGFFVN